MVFLTISQVFIDVGFASALIQSQDTTSLTYSSIFYLNVALGLILTGLLYFAAPLVGAFYNNDKITDLVRWLSPVFFFNSLDVVQMTILRKELNFKALTIRTFISVIAGGVAGIIAALFGLGVYSLVIQNIITAIVGTISLWSTSTWRPDLKFSMQEVRKLTGFSTYVFFDRIFSSISQQLDVLAVGKLLSPAMLGFYSRATSLRNIVTTYSSSSLIAVFYPVLSSLQDNEVEYKKVYFKVISVIAFLSYLITGLMCILGSDVILFLFGEKWLNTVGIFQVLILMACNTPINSMMINAFLSTGKSKENFWIGILRKILRLLPLAVLYFYDMFYFTIAIVILSYFITILNILFLYKYAGIDYKKHFIRIFEGMVPLSIALCAFFYFNPQSFIIRFVWAISFLGAYLFFAMMLKTEGFSFLVVNLKPILNKTVRRIIP